jgi:hypothetical protein
MTIESRISPYSLKKSIRGYSTHLRPPRGPLLVLKPRRIWRKRRCLGVGCLRESRITNFRITPYAVDSVFGLYLVLSAISAWRALFESDFESEFSRMSWENPDLKRLAAAVRFRPWLPRFQ